MIPSGPAKRLLLGYHSKTTINRTLEFEYSSVGDGSNVRSKGIRERCASEWAAFGFYFRWRMLYLLLGHE